MNSLTKSSKNTTPVSLQRVISENCIPTRQSKRLRTERVPNSKKFFTPPVIKTHRQFKKLAAELPELLQQPCRDDYNDRDELIEDPLMELQGERNFPIHPGRLSPILDTLLVVETVKVPEIVEPAKPVETIKETKIEMKPKRQTPKTRRPKKKTFTDADENKKPCYSAVQTRSTEIAINDFYIGVSDRRLARVPYYYDENGNVKRFTGLTMTAGHLNVRCFECKIKGKITQNVLVLNEAHAGDCKGTTCTSFILEQRFRRATYFKTADAMELFKYCNEQRFYNDPMMNP